MDGAGIKLWGYYPTDKTWVPLQVDADGKVKVDLSAVNLDDLGDVSVPTPGDQYLLYWDAATSLWKCRALVDGDIPAAIARDDEVIAALIAEVIDRNAAIAAVKLDDLADVSVASPTNGYFVYWDSATSLWKCKALAATDIPSLDAAKITSGILNPARVGPKIQDADADTSWDVEESADEDKVHGKVKGVEAFLLHDDGILDLAKQSYVFVYGNTDQSVPNATWTPMNLNTIVTDKQGEYNTTTHLFTAKKAGVYMISAAIKTLANTVAGQYICLGVLKNGGWLFDVYVIAAAANKYTGVNGSTIVTLAAGDTLQLTAYQTSGGAQIFAGTIGSMNLAVAKIG